MPIDGEWIVIATTCGSAFTSHAGRGLGTYYLPGWDAGGGPMAAGIAELPCGLRRRP